MTAMNQILNKIQKMTDKSYCYVLLSLIVASFLIFASEQACCGSSTEDAATSLDTQRQSELQPPEWQIGDTWVVETEIFDQGNIMKRSDAMGWSEKQAWRFEVLENDSIENHRCHHLQITPIEGNTCPYTFELWLRIADLRLSAFQIVYPADDGSSNRHAPRSVRKHISGNHTPGVFFDYFKARFPSLPLWLLPQFNAGMISPESGASARRGPHTKLGQKITTHSGPLPVDQATATLGPNRTEKTSSSSYHKVTLAYGDSEEIQFWQDGRPWPVYGYRSGKNGMEKRYQLTHIGRENTPE
jgi:hypothetical protein